MTFADAVSTVLTKKYADFSGRARRSEFWYFYLFTVILNIVVLIIESIIGTPIIGYVVSLALIVPQVALAIRRLHDTGRSGWWLLILFTFFFGIFVLIVWWCLDSKPDNQYGPNPKGIAGGMPGYGQQPGPYGQQPGPYGG